MVTSQPAALTRLEIESGLRALGVTEGMSVEVHSSLSRFGTVAGGAETVVAALLKCVGQNGAIIMSAYPVSKVLPLTDEDKANGLTCKVRIFPEDSDEASGMGVIADTFRRRPDVIVGKSVHRVAAWGCDARLHAERGYAHLIAIDGYALLLGVDINRLSSMHSMEGDMPAELWKLFGLPAEIGKKYPPDQWYVETGNNTTAVGWNKIQAEAFEKGLIRERQIGQARCLLFKVNDVVELYSKALKMDPFALFGVKRADSADDDQLNGMKGRDER